MDVAFVSFIGYPAGDDGLADRLTPRVQLHT